jgi:transposase
LRWRLEPARIIGAAVPCHGPSNPADQSALCEAVRKGSKNDAADAEAIYEAALRPTMRFVAVKSIEQKDLQSLHRARERVVCARTALINHMRGPLAEYGVIVPQGAWRFTTQVTTAIEEAELSDLTREIFIDMLDQFNDLNRQLDKLDAQLVTICRTNEACRRLSKLPGVGPVIATALVAAVDDGRHSARAGSLRHG